MPVSRRHTPAKRKPRKRSSKIVYVRAHASRPRHHSVRATGARRVSRRPTGRMSLRRSHKVAHWRSRTNGIGYTKRPKAASYRMSAAKMKSPTISYGKSKSKTVYHSASKKGDEIAIEKAAKAISTGKAKSATVVNSNGSVTILQANVPASQSKKMNVKRWTFMSALTAGLALVGAAGAVVRPTTQTLKMPETGVGVYNAPTVKVTQLPPGAAPPLPPRGPTASYNMGQAWAQNPSVSYNAGQAWVMQQ